VEEFGDISKAKGLAQTAYPTPLALKFEVREDIIFGQPGHHQVA
jgi:hypothetical protein